MPAVKQAGRHGAASTASTIIDIRGDPVELDLKNEVVTQLNPPTGPRKLPTLLLYDMKGLQLFEDVGRPASKQAPRVS